MMIKTSGKLYLKPKLSVFLIIIILILSFSPGRIFPDTEYRVNGDKNPYFTSPNASKLAFISQVKNGNPEQVTGLWLPNLTGLMVEEQPAGQSGFVSDQPGKVTHFQLAADFGSIGLLAHSYLAGAFFNDLESRSDQSQLFMVTAQRINIR